MHAAAPRRAAGSIMMIGIAAPALHEHAVASALAHADDPYRALVDRVGGARVVLIGEASHGTREFYRERAEITRRLLERKGFAAVAVEADWPDALRVNRYVTGAGDDTDAADALGGFKRFPTWMWRNAEVLDFVGWLRDFNAPRPERSRVGFYGLDLYSLQSSIAEVLRYLERVDPAAAAQARKRYSCFDEVADPQDYGFGVALGITESCREEAVAALVELQRRSQAYLHRDGTVAADEYFYAEQNARVAKDAEEYYRTMIDYRVSSWNLRDRHMFETLQALEAHLARHRESRKIIVWAHNSHVGNASATEMSSRGEHNIGELANRHYGAESALIGFTTYSGTVSAATDWGGAVERKNVRPGMARSYEALFHEAGVPQFSLMLDDPAVRAACRGPLLERAIGVVYRPETERQSHYFESRLPEQFDIVIHIDHTGAVEPLERTATWDTGEPPETYPTGL
jgi:erythromycin esterase-like protein